MVTSGHYAARDPAGPASVPAKKRPQLGPIQCIALTALVCLLYIVGASENFVPPAKLDLASRPGLELVPGRMTSQIEPAVYDPDREIRVAVSEVSGQGAPEPSVLLLRGPWNFGVSELDSVAEVLGTPVRRGPGRLVYQFADGRVRLTLLFRAQRLDTIVLAPQTTPGGAHYSWWMTSLLADHERLVWRVSDDTSERCGLLSAPSSGLHYAVCPVEGEGQDWTVRAIYIQRLPPPEMGLTNTRRADPMKLQAGSAVLGLAACRYHSGK